MAMFERADAQGRELTAKERDDAASLLDEARAQKHVEDQIKQLDYGNVPWDRGIDGIAGGSGLGDQFVSSKEYLGIRNPASRSETWTSGVVELATRGTLLTSPGTALTPAAYVPGVVESRIVMRVRFALRSPEQEVEQTGNEWASLFAAGGARTGCAYETQPVCERIACEHVGHVPIKNCTPPSAAFRRSFEDATVQDIAIKGQNAGVKFSNGEAVELVQVEKYPHCIGSACPGEGRARTVWWVSKFGGNAGREFFE
jgi:hypothetical protein